MLIRHHDCHCRFMYDIMHGIDIITAAISPAQKEGALAPDPAEPPPPPAVGSQLAVPMNILVRLTRASLVLPASSK